MIIATAFERSAVAFVCPYVIPIIIIQMHKLMEIENNKDLYEAPSTRVMELKIEGIICSSGLNDPTDYSNGSGPFSFQLLSENSRL